jgi:hypothetical protein
MDKNNEDVNDEKDNKLDEGEEIERGFEQMELLYRSRCVQAPTGSNVTVREIEKED